MVGSHEVDGGGAVVMRRSAAVVGCLLASWESESERLVYVDPGRSAAPPGAPGAHGAYGRMLAGLRWSRWSTDPSTRSVDARLIMLTIAARPYRRIFLPLPPVSDVPDASSHEGGARWFSLGDSGSGGDFGDSGDF